MSAVNKEGSLYEGRRRRKTSSPAPARSSVVSPSATVENDRRLSVPKTSLSYAEAEPNLNDDSLIEIFSKIQEAMLYANLDSRMPALPKIAVIGQQSVGKSSVLESVVGFSFLPKGLGTVTRRPTMIELKNSKHSKRKKAILKDPARGAGNLYFSEEDIDENKLTAAIVNATDEHVRKKDVSPDPIIVEIHGPDLLDLTLVDMPGVVADPPEMRRKIERMVNEEIAKDSTIILVVHPAGVDKQNDTALAMANAVDPFCRRTYGVLTKPDELTDLEAKKIQYKTYDILVPVSDSATPPVSPAQTRSSILWVPVKNVAVYNTLQIHSLANQRAEEEEFFQKEAATFKRLGIAFAPSGDKGYELAAGIGFLCKTLKLELSDRIKAYLQKTRRDLKAANNDLAKDLEELEKQSDEDAFTREAKSFLIEFWTKFEKQVHGHDLTQHFKEEALGARINDLFTGNFEDDMYAVDPLQDIESEDVARIIKNAKGAQNSIYLPMTAVQRLLRHTLDAHVIKICKKLVDDVFNELFEHAKQLTNSQGSNKTRSALRIWAFEQTIEVLQELKEECEKFVANTVMMERRINSEHPDFPQEADLKEIINVGTEPSMPVKPPETTNKDIGPGDLPGKSLSLVDSDKREIEASLMEVGDKLYLEAGDLFIPLDSIKIAESPKQTEEKKDSDSPGSEFLPLFSYRKNRGTMKKSFGCKAHLRGGYEDILTLGKKGVGRIAVPESESSSVVMEAKQRYKNDAVQHRDRRRNNKDKEVQLTVELYVQYFNKIVRIKILDSVPKAISLLIVNKIDEEHILQRELDAKFDNLRKEDGIQEIMQWTVEDARKKEEVEKANRALTQALNALANSKLL